MGDVERFQIIRPLGDAAGFVARDMSVHPPRLVVLERVTRSPTATKDRERIQRQALALVGFEHPKVVPVREVIQRDGEILVVCDFVDGEWFSLVLSIEPRASVEVLLRLVLDVLEGLAALHDLKDDRGHPLGVVHGALSPSSVLVADDGVAEIAGPFGVPMQKPDRFVAPELRRGEAPADVRADVYSAGAMLREVLGMAPSDAKWVEQLTDVAWRACSVDPENRWPSAAAMATTLRRTVGARLASGDDVASFMNAIFGARMRARRAALDALDSVEEAPPSSGEPISLRPSDMMVVVDPSSAPTLVESVPPPRPKAVAVGKVQLVKKAVELADIPEPAVERVASGSAHAATMRGMAAMAVPGGSPGPSALPPPRAKAASLPPPDIIVPEPTKPTSLPPPDILVPEQVAVAAVASIRNDAYRRRMPTFPTLDVPKKKETSGVAVMAVLAAMVTTFGLGWWLGRNHPPPSDAPVPACAPAPTAPAVATATAASPTPPAVGVSVAASPTVTSPATSPTATTTIAAAMPAVTSAGTSTATATPTATAVAAHPVATWTPPPATPKPPVTAVATTPAPTATATEPAPGPPRPAGSAGYVPSEL